MKKIALAVAIAAASGSLMAQSIGKPEDQVRWRQSAYQTMAWNMGRVKANIDGAYNKDQVIQAANVIQAIANSGMGALYAPGTEKAKGWEPTHAKPELFTDKEGVGKVAVGFNKEANEFAKAAATGDAPAVKAQFAKLVEACKACHKDYRVEEKH
jgi:cytochrome c556